MKRKKKTAVKYSLVLVLCVLMISMSIFSYASESDSLSPQVQSIKEKKFYIELEKLNKKEDVDKYLKKLDNKALLQTIAETADELQKNGDVSEMVMFNEHVEEKLMNELEEMDYTELINNDDYSDLFRIYMINAYSYNRMKQKDKKEKEVNKALRRIIKGKSNSSNLKFYALKEIDNFDNDDKEM